MLARFSQSFANLMVSKIFYAARGADAKRLWDAIGWVRAQPEFAGMVQENIPSSSGIATMRCFGAIAAPPEIDQKWLKNHLRVVPIGDISHIYLKNIRIFSSLETDILFQTT